jgi:hypothetical protein
LFVLFFIIGLLRYGKEYDCQIKNNKQLFATVQFYLGIVAYVWDESSYYALLYLCKLSG